MARFLLLVILIASCRGQSQWDLLVQGAMDSELQPLLSALEGKQETRLHAWTFWTGKIGSKRVVISRTEMGPLNATAATVLGIERFHPKAIINQGTAGAHNPDLKIYDIVLGEKTTDYGAYKSDHGDAGSGVDVNRWKPLHHSLRMDGVAVQPYPNFVGDSAMIAVAQKVAYKYGRVVKGNIGSAYLFNRELDLIHWLRKTYGTDTEDMESHFSAGVATALKTPFLAIRIISDSEWNHPKFEKISGEYCAQFVVDFIRRLP